MAILDYPALKAKFLKTFANVPVPLREEIIAVIAREWLLGQGLSLPIVAVGGGVTKAKACQGLDTYVDDDLDKLEPLAGIVPRLFLFSWGYNRHIEVPADLAQRVDSWRDFYEKITIKENQE